MSDLLTASAPGRHAGAASRIRSAGRRERKTAGEWIKPPLIALAGLLGVIGVLLAVMPFFGWNTVVLATGSMGPTYPAGSVLLSHQVAASEVAVGDVVTIVRAGRAPITHRVIGIESVAGDFATVRSLTLQGDANSAPDQEPYTVDRVGLVAGGIPWGGQVLTAIRSPLMLAVLTVLVAGLVLWSWWPSAAGNKGVGADEET